MKMFNNMKVGVRLIVVFAIILAGLVAISFFSTNAISQLVTADQEMYEGNLLAVSGVADVIDTFFSLRISLMKSVYENYSLQSLESDFATDKDAIGKFVSYYQATILNDEDQANLDKLNNLLASYYSQVDKVIVAEKGGDMETAKQEILLAAPVGADVVAQLDFIKQFNSDFASSKASNNKSLGITTTLTLIIVSSGVFLLAIFIAFLVTISITKPIGKLVGTAQKLVHGEIDTEVELTGKDEVSMLARAFVNVINTFKSVIGEMNHMSEQHNLGDIDVMIPEEKYEGAYREVVAGVNSMVAGHIAVKKKAMACVAEFSRGNFEASLEKFPGKKAFINDNIELLRKNLKALNADAIMLVDAALDGKLSTRADVSKHEGDFRKIVDGVNKTLDAVIEPVTEAATVLNEMSQGNLSVSVVGSYKGDHAAIKDALNDTIDTIKGYIGEISQVLTDLADGNLNTGIKREYRGEFTQIKESINNIVDSLNNVLGEINASAEQVAAGTQQVSAGSQALSQGATEQASAIEQLTASLSEIAGQTKKNAENAALASELANTAREEAVDGNTRMDGLQQAMKEINESSANISKIIKVIDEIAFQTNLLALNAAVEAARAGQHGKGFAVVAEEVRNLAQRSANAAKETTTMIEESIKKVKGGTAMADETAQALTKIVKGVEKATDLVGGIAKASNDQATAVAQVNTGIEQVSQVVQTNSATAEESAAASEELSSQATLLREMVGRFSLKGQTGIKKPEKAAPGERVKQLGTGKQSAGKPIIAMNDRDFGKY